MNSKRRNTVSQIDRINFLKKVDIFQATEEEVLTVIAEQIDEVFLLPEQVLFHKGDEGNTMYIVVEGTIKIHDGDYIFNIMCQGQAFGEYAMLDTEVRSASISSVTQSVLLELKQDVFYNVLMRNNNTTQGILQTLVKRARLQNQLEEKLAESNKIIQQKKSQLKIEKKKSDDLLLNILPQDIATELKIRGYSEPRNYELVSVLFADIKGFTAFSEHLSSKELLKNLEFYFTAFDDIMEKHGLEKIKTIGDAYMAAGGIPKRNTSNPIEITCAALIMQQFVREQKKERDFSWELRLGIHTGPLVAGVIGKNKFAYDIWGDTVNIASRMESMGEVNRVNVSRSTYELIKDYFDCEYRGKIEVKGKGTRDMYFVNRLKEEFSEDQEGLVPTQSFLNAIQIMRRG